MIKSLKYIRKDLEDIFIPSRLEGCDRWNPINWKVIPHYSVNYYTNNQISYRLNPEKISKVFFTFIFTDSNFPLLSKKECLPIIKKYKFSKIYIIRSEKLWCYYFKRGVLFDTQICVDDKNKKTIMTKRLFKLIKLNDYEK